VQPHDVDDAIRRLRGTAGTPVAIAIARGTSAPRNIRLVRSAVAVTSVHSDLLPGAVAYLHIAQFSESTTRDVRAALRDLTAASGTTLNGLVLDLRDNPGGVLDAAVEVADLFLEQGDIVTTRGRTAENSTRLTARSGDLLDGAPIAVLVNRRSASAAEILAGALQDQHRATVMGQRTFGKGSVQTVLPLAGGSAIKLTTGRYLTPSGQSIQGRGIAPDVTLAVATAVPGDWRQDQQIRAALALLRPNRLARDSGTG
jgi:carboxyl-terminal processing protease